MKPKDLLKTYETKYNSLKIRLQEEEEKTKQLIKNVGQWRNLVNLNANQKNKLSELQEKLANKDVEDLKASTNRIKAYKDQMAKASAYMEKAKNDIEAEARRQKELREKYLENMRRLAEAKNTALTSRFEGFVWYQDVQEKITEGLGNLTD